MSSHISDESPLSRGENDSLCAVGPYPRIEMPSALFCILKKRERRVLITRKVSTKHSSFLFFIFIFYLFIFFFFFVDRNIGYLEGTVYTMSCSRVSLSGFASCEM
jgi:hypothetical protein